MFVLALSAVACGGPADSSGETRSPSELQQSSSSQGASNAGRAGAPAEQVDPNLLGKGKRSGTPETLEPRDGGMPADGGDTADQDAARPWWITDSPDGGANTGSGGASASGTGGIPGGSGGAGGIPQGSGGSGSDPGTGGTGAGTGGAPSIAPTQCKIAGGATYGCDAATKQLHPSVVIMWGYDPNWDGTSPDTTYTCTSTNAPACAVGGPCRAVDSVAGTTKEGTCL